MIGRRRQIVKLAIKRAATSGPGMTVPDPLDGPAAINYRHTLAL
jgi:hypothetical protein